MQRKLIVDAANDFFINNHIDMNIFNQIIAEYLVEKNKDATKGLNMFSSIPDLNIKVLICKEILNYYVRKLEISYLSEPVTDAFGHSVYKKIMYC